MTVPPAARAAVHAVTAALGEPVMLLVTGGIGSGKSSALAAVRAQLRAASVPVLPRPPRAGEDPRSAVVVDDAHLLDDDALAALRAHVDDRAGTVVIACERLASRGALTALLTALEQENPAITLGPLNPTEIASAARELGVEPSPDQLRTLTAATAGLPLLVAAALRDVESAPRQARFALVERVRRLDAPLLDALLLLSLNAEVGTADVAAALRVDPGDAHALVDRARASGLVDPTSGASFQSFVHDCVAQIVGVSRHHEVETTLLASLVETATLSDDLALTLAEHGVRDEHLANTLADAAARPGVPAAAAARLYRAAAGAGRPGADVALAESLALSGDCAGGGRLAEELLTSDDPARRAAAVRIAAGIAAHDGAMAQAADLYRWLGPNPDAASGAAGTVALAATGDLAAARAALDAPRQGPPTIAARAARTLAEGVLASVTELYPAVIARLSQALGGEGDRPVVAPDTPAALVTLAAVHGGDPVRARSVIARAVRADTAADAGPFFAHRHRLLQGWVRMQDGQLRAATAGVKPQSALHRRDALWAGALQTAIARRAGDSGALHTHWQAATEVLSEYAIDLFTLLPLGELWVAAARLGQTERVQHSVDEAFALLDELGNPVLWSAPLQWAGVHAGILANAPESVAPYGAALTKAAAHSPFARALATAGRTWLRVLAHHVDPDEVGAAANGLCRFGLTWDATRLASQAALQTPDSRTSSAMLQLARDLKHTIAIDEAAIEAAGTEPGPSAESRGDRPRPASSKLSDREREVAELLLLGRSYRDIGAQLLISAKTVEHHVARIRRRLGAESRSEMLSMLRALLDVPTGR
ncbi:isoniazid response ATPase/transcriptional regulator IniR [Mycolicibacterium sp.]|uniref:isoniazid response ATPase/transcriptional regulator IniR n=1 Tax=Mycolicibacterium sp. TaxID=2320850 RepID=UPI003D11467E